MLFGRVAIAAAVLLSLHPACVCSPRYTYFVSNADYVFCKHATATAYSGEQQLLHAVDDSCKSYGTTYGLLGLMVVRGVRLLVSISKATQVGCIANQPVYRVDEVKLLPERPGMGFIDTQYAEITSWVFQKTFYFSDYPLDGDNEDYVANQHMLAGLKRQDQAASLVVKAITGHVGITMVDGVNVAVINRLCNKRMGLSTYVYGLDDNGNCANFGESEVVVEDKGKQQNRVVIHRGTPPLRVSDDSLNKLGTKEDQLKYLKAHLSTITKDKKPVHIVDLLDGTASAQKPFHDMLQKVVDLAQTEKMDIHLHSLTKFVKDKQAKEALQQQKEASQHPQEATALGSIVGWAKSVGGKLADKAAQTAKQMVFRSETRDLEAFIGSLTLPRDAVIRVHCMDSVRDTDDAIAMIVPKLLRSARSPPSSPPNPLPSPSIASAIKIIFDTAKASLLKQYFAGRADKDAGLVDKLMDLGASQLAPQNQAALDCVYGTHWSPCHDDFVGNRPAGRLNAKTVSSVLQGE